MAFLIYLIQTIFNVLTLVVLAKVILSYFMQPYHPVRQFIDRLVEPMLVPIRRLLPQTGMLDFSPMVLLILLQLVERVLVSVLIRIQDIEAAMESREFHFHSGRKGAAITVRVTPRASKNEITEVQADGTVKIRLTSPPVDGRANEALILFLAEVLGVAKSRLEIVAGQTGREKLVTILDMDAETVQARIMKHIA